MLNANAILLRARQATATIDGVLLTRIFFDDFNRSVARGLGGEWSWHWEDSNPSRNSNEALATVDGTEHALHLVSPTTGSVWESYVGFPLPLTGDLFFDFYVTSSPFTSGRPTYGFTLDVSHYTGIYVSPTNATLWQLATWTSVDAPYNFAPTANTWYRVHHRWTSDRIQSRVWKVGDAEPTSWNIDIANAYDFPGDPNQPPILDLYYSPNGPTEAMRMTNIAVWATQSEWTKFGGTPLDSVLWNPVVEASLTANAILFKTIWQALTTTGSVDTFTEAAQINLIDHVPDAGPRWGAGTQNVVVFDGKWWPLNSAQSRMDIHQGDYDISFDWFAYGSNRLVLRYDTTGMNAVIFYVNRSNSYGGGVGIAEMRSGSWGYAWSASFTAGTRYRVRCTLIGQEAKIYIDGTLRASRTLTYIYPNTLLELAGDYGSVIDNWSFPYPVGAGFLLDAVIDPVWYHFTAAAVLFATMLKSYPASAVFMLPGIASSFGLDAIVSNAVVTQYLFTMGAWLFATMEHSTLANAVIFLPGSSPYAPARSFGINSYIAGPQRARHSRDNSAHYDFDQDTIITFADALGIYTQGEDLHSILASIAARVDQLEASSSVANIQTLFFGLGSIMLRPMVHSIGLDADIMVGHRRFLSMSAGAFIAYHFSAGAWIRNPAFGSFDDQNYDAGAFDTDLGSPI